MPSPTTETVQHELTVLQEALAVLSERLGPDGDASGIQWAFKMKQHVDGAWRSVGYALDHFGKSYSA